MSNETSDLEERMAALEDRLVKLEGLVETIAKHQAGLGSSVIRAHQKLIELESDMTPGVREHPGQPLIGFDKPKLVS